MISIDSASCIGYIREVAIYYVISLHLRYSSEETIEANREVNLQEPSCTCIYVPMPNHAIFVRSFFTSVCVEALRYNAGSYTH